MKPLLLRTTLTLAASAALASLSLTSPALAAPVAFQQLPPAVQATITRETAGGTIEEIEREDGQGVTTYEVEFRRADARYELEIAADGTLLRSKPD